MTFLSLELRSTKIIGWLYPGGEICVTGCHVTSRNQGLSSNDQGRQRRETLGTRLLERPVKLAPPLHALSDWAIAVVRRLLSQSGAGR